MIRIHLRTGQPSTKFTMIAEDVIDALEVIFHH